MKDKNTKNDKIELSLPLSRKLLKYTIAIIIIVGIAYTAFAAPQKIGDFISAVVSLLSPFLIGFCLAYVVNLLLRPIERFWAFIWRKLKNKSIVDVLKRPVCLTISFLIVLGALFAIVFMIMPALTDTFTSFAKDIPQYAKTIEGWGHSAAEFFAKYGIDIPEISLNTEKINALAGRLISNYGGNVIDTTVNITASIVGVVFDMVLGFVFAIYMLAQKEKLGAQTKKAVFAIFKPKRAERIVDITSLTNSVFTKFVTGQLAEAVIIGVLCYVGMKIFAMPNAGIISVLIGFTALIPMFGAYIGTAVGAFLILLEEPVKAFWFVVFIIVLQQLEGNLIYPRVVGKSVGLPGIRVLTAVTIGGGLFGVVGMLFSVPICSVLYVLFKEFVNKKTAERDTIVQEENI